MSKRRTIARSVLIFEKRCRLKLANSQIGPDVRAQVRVPSEVTERHYRFGGTRGSLTRPGSLFVSNDPQTGVVQELYPRTAMCVRNVDVHVSCSSHDDARLAAFFIDPRAK